MHIHPQNPTGERQRRHWSDAPGAHRAAHLRLLLQPNLWLAAVAVLAAFVSIFWVAAAISRALGMGEGV